MSPRHPLEGVSQIQGAARDRRRPLGLTIKRQETFARRVKAQAPGRQSCKRKLLPPRHDFFNLDAGALRNSWNGGIPGPPNSRRSSPRRSCTTALRIFTRLRTGTGAQDEP